MYVTLLCMLLSVEYEDALTWLNFPLGLYVYSLGQVLKFLAFGWLREQVTFVLAYHVCLFVYFNPYFSLHMCVPAGER